MARESLATVTRRRVSGVLYIALVIGLVWLSIAFYQQKFTPVSLVTLRTDHTGNELQAGADVKERGIIVGQVRDVQVESGPNGGCADPEKACVQLTLALDPSKTAIIPDNVSARILPKTIFGEQYVDLQLPPQPGPAIKAGDVIAQDRSKGALETSKVLGDLLPLLQAVKPAELNATLTAIATALQGRGYELGHTLSEMDHYLGQFNPHVKQLADDLGQLGKVSDVYTSVAPDLLQMLRNMQTTDHTIVTQQKSLSTLLTTATSTTNVIDSFLADNQRRLITVTDTSNAVYSRLAEYSSEFPCLFQGMAKLYHQVVPVTRGHAFNLSVVADQTNLGKYKPGQQPILVTGYGPNCFGLPNNPQPRINGHFQIPPKYQCLNDGAPLTANPCAQRRNSTVATGSNPTQSAAQIAMGSPAENALVDVLISGSYGNRPEDVPPIATMLAAPLLRGQEVSVK